MLPPVTRNVHSPHASFSKTSGNARQISRNFFIAGFESSYMRGCAIARLAHFLWVAIHQVLPDVSFTPPTRSPQVMSAGSLIGLAPRLTARLYVASHSGTKETTQAPH